MAQVYKKWKKRSGWRAKFGFDWEEGFRFFSCPGVTAVPLAKNCSRSRKNRFVLQLFSGWETQEACDGGGHTTHRLLFAYLCLSHHSLFVLPLYVEVVGSLLLPFLDIEGTVVETIFM